MFVICAALFLFCFVVVVVVVAVLVFIVIVTAASPFPIFTSFVWPFPSLWSSTGDGVKRDYAYAMDAAKPFWCGHNFCTSSAHESMPL